MLKITFQLVAILTMLLVMNIPSMAKFGITPVRNPISEFLVFDLEYTLKDFFSFFNLSTVLILPGFSDTEVIFLFYLSINAQMCLGCLKALFLGAKLTFYWEVLKKNKKETA